MVSFNRNNSFKGHFYANLMTGKNNSDEKDLAEEIYSGRIFRGYAPRCVVNKGKKEIVFIAKDRWCQDRAKHYRFSEIQSSVQQVFGKGYNIKVLLEKECKLQGTVYICPPEQKKLEFKPALRRESPNKLYVPKKYQFPCVPHDGNLAARFLLKELKEGKLEAIVLTGASGVGKTNLIYETLKSLKDIPVGYTDIGDLSSKLQRDASCNFATKDADDLLAALSQKKFIAVDSLHLFLDKNGKIVKPGVQSRIVTLHDESLRTNRKIIYTFKTSNFSFGEFLEKLQGTEIGSRIAELESAEISPPTTDKLNFIRNLLSSRNFPQSALEQTAREIYLSLSGSFGIPYILGKMNRAMRQLGGSQASIDEEKIRAVLDGIQDGTAKKILEAFETEEELIQKGYTLREIFGYSKDPYLVVLRGFCVDALSCTTLTFEEIGKIMNGRTSAEVKGLKDNLEKTISADKLKFARECLVEAVPSLKF